MISLLKCVQSVVRSLYGEKSPADRHLFSKAQVSILLTKGIVENLSDAREFSVHLQDRTRLSVEGGYQIHLCHNLNPDIMLGKLTCQEKERGELSCVESNEVVTCEMCLREELKFFQEEKEKNDLQERAICG